MTVDVLPFVSVVVPIRNEERFIANTLSQLFALDYPRDRFEVIVADGMSNDSTRQIVAGFAERFPNLKVVDNPPRWSSAGRNAGINASRGDVVLIIDGHCEIQNDQYLRCLVKALDQHAADCAGRPQPLEIPNPSLLQRAIALARSSWLGHHPASYIYSKTEQIVPAHSVAIAYRRQVFDQVGMFDESFDACEDVELNCRVDHSGLRCVLVPDLRVVYYPRDTLPKLFRQLGRYGRGRVRLLRKHPHTFSLMGFSTGAFAAGVLLGPFVGLLSPILMWLYVTCLLIYATVVGLTSLAVALRSGQWKVLPLLPIVYATIHMGSGCGILQELIVQAVRGGGSQRSPVGIPTTAKS